MAWQLRGRTKQAREEKRRWQRLISVLLNWPLLGHGSSSMRTDTVLTLAAVIFGAIGIGILYIGTISR